MSSRAWHRPAFVGCTLLYIVGLQWAYVAVVTRIWAYAGYTFSAPPLGYWITFSLVALTPSLWIRTSLSRPSQWLYLYLYAVVFIPTCLIPLLRAGSIPEDPSELVPLIATMFACMATLGLTYRLPLVRIPRIRLPRPAFWALLIGATAAAYLVVYRVFGASLSLTGDVLPQRLLGRETYASASSTTLLGYALNWPSYVINPLLLAVGLWYRRRAAFTLGVGGQVFAYSVNAVRGALATIPVALVLWISLRQRRVPFAIFWMGFFALIVAGSVGAQWAGRTIQLTASWVLLRAFVGLGYITGVYYDFFRHSPQTMFAHIRGLGWLGHNPYAGTGLGFVIGQSLGQPTNNANANLFADGFASYGLLGMVLVTVITAAAFHMIDSALAKTDSRFATTAVGVQAMNLADLPIFTTLLGGGLGLVTFLIYLVPQATRTVRISTKSLETRNSPTV
jgi:hypothetical protein